MIKAVFSDIDQTLFSHKSKTVPSSAIRAVDEMMNKGIKFYLCSGRNAYLIRKSGVYDFIRPDGIVTMNGAQAIIGDESIYLHPIPEDVVDALIKFAKRLRFGLTLIEEKEGHINMIDERVISAHEKYGTRFPQPRTFPDHYDRVVYQAIAYCDAFDESLFLPHLKECKTARWDEYAVYIMP
ncbi:MAG: HAD hydrolase family protein, partial [Bacilli bacterium]